MSRGWCVHELHGHFDVWTIDDTRCPFKISPGMIGRLLDAGKLEYVDGPGFWDRWLMMK